MKRTLKRLTALALALSLLAALPWNVSAEIAPPDDVDWPAEAGGVRGTNTAWYARAVYDLYYTGICLDIMDENNVVPGKTMTRGEFITLLRGLAWYASKLDQEPESCYDPDRETLYMDGTADSPTIYRDALDWAVQNRILYGDGSSLRPDAPMTRQEMAVILVRFADYMGLELGQTDSYGQPLEKLFCDAGQVSRWAKSAVEEAAWRGLIRGSERFGGFYDPETGVHACGIVPYVDPRDTVTRAQGYQAVWNYAKAAGIYLMWRNEFVDWHRWSAE